MAKIVILVHGWGVHHTSSYGKLAARLAREAARGSLPNIDLRNIWLSQYVSFDDEVQLTDLSHAFEAALRRELGSELSQGRDFACITHSTGGPVVRDWFDRYYARPGRHRACPMSHLIMLAPANHGSALATLGKSRLGRIKAWFEGVEPGAGILDWLTPGSPASWALNRASVDYPDLSRGRGRLFSFVLTGQSIDRHLYDFLNSYTGEAGSDGVVRAAAANLNTSYLQLVQSSSGQTNQAHDHPLQLVQHNQAAETAFALIPGVSHSGKRMGILRSIGDNNHPHPTVGAIIDCLGVHDARSYDRLKDRFAEQNRQLMHSERVDLERIRGFPDRTHIIDPHAMVIFRVRDSDGRAVSALDLLLCAGPHDSPNELPEGFLADRQRNPVDPGSLCFYFNHAVMTGSPEVRDHQSKLLRPQLPGADKLGLRIDPHVTEGLAHYLSCQLISSPQLLRQVIRPHATTLVDVVLQRAVREGAFRLSRDAAARSIKRVKPGPIIETE